MIQQFQLRLPEYRRGYHLITSHIERCLKDLPEQGMVNVFIKHTSAGLTINENADPSVRADFETIMNRLAPENGPGYQHTLEGLDDMPAHIKSSLIGASLTIPVVDGRLGLGTWQGIYLCEFRNYGGSRQLVITVYS
ncbi:secondary thiamine-phosphate synthase enzyme YjbQ [Geofilum sp. OHC36d9]|uniref:secondary thiamine-phosphate synthase enzyme YjbQ n=1 Tax=Geofilum sp. OHC36d9 TaxID=3458413 RepID=UPI0040341EF1